MSASEAAPGLLLPAPDPVEAPFWDGCARGELVVQVCSGCGRLRFPPRPMCPACNSLDLHWRALSGSGRIWSFVIAHPPLLPAYLERAPYPVIVVELDEHPTLRMVGALVARPGEPLDVATLSIGAPVHVAFERIDDVTLPRWLVAQGDPEGGQPPRGSGS